MVAREGSNSFKSKEKKGSSTNPAVMNAPVPQHTPYGFMPKLPAEDEKVDWVRNTIEVKAYFKRFVGFVKVLL